MLARQARHENAHPRLTQGAAIAYQGMRMVILNMFMDAVRDESAQRMSRLCFEAALRQFLLALKRVNCNSHLLEIMGACMSRLRSGTDLIVSMTVVRHLMNVFQPDAYVENRVFIEELLKNRNAVLTTVNSYRAYKLLASRAHDTPPQVTRVTSTSRFPPLSSPGFSSSDGKDLLTPSGLLAPLSFDVNKLVTGRNPHYCHEMYLHFIGVIQNRSVWHNILKKS